MLMLAGGGEACSDIEHLHSQPALFGSMASDSTLYRTFRSITPETLTKLWESLAEDHRVAPAASTTGNATVVVDIDSSLHQIHSENKNVTSALLPQVSQALSSSQRYRHH